MGNPFDPGYYCSEELREFGFASVGDNVRISKDCVIIGLENISLGHHCRVDSGTKLIAAGGRIIFGNFVHIHTNCLIGGRGGVTIGDYSSLSHQVCVISATDDFRGGFMFGSVVPAEFTRPTVAPVDIGTHVPVGMQSAILPGVTVGDGAAICVQTMVRKSLDPWAMYQGNPARRIAERKRDVLELEARHKADLMRLAA